MLWGICLFIFLLFLIVIDVKLSSAKDSDDLTNSIDVSSSDEQNEDETLVPAVPEIVVDSIDTPHLETQETLDDVDEEEAFITELMALHPNDDDIVVVDLENDDLENDEPQIPEVEVQEVDEVQQADETIHEAEEAIESVVRNTFVNGLPSIALSFGIDFPSWSLLSVSLSPFSARN